jgi:HAMP domain-containing protein
VACLFFQLLVVLIGRRVVRPLVQATDLVSGLVDGKLEQQIPEGQHRDEIGAMMRALRVLKERMRERNSLAKERSPDHPAADLLQHRFPHGRAEPARLLYPCRPAAGCRPALWAGGVGGAVRHRSFQAHQRYLWPPGR